MRFWPQPVAMEILKERRMFRQYFFDKVEVRPDKNCYFLAPTVPGLLNS